VLQGKEGTFNLILSKINNKNSSNNMPQKDSSLSLIRTQITDAK